MRISEEDFSTRENTPDSNLKQLEKSLQMVVQGELGIIPEDKEIFVKECEGFELVIDLDSLKLSSIKDAINEAYDEYRFDDGETLKSMFMEDNDSFSEEEVDALIAKLAEDLEEMKLEIDSYSDYDDIRTAV